MKKRIRQQTEYYNRTGKFIGPGSIDLREMESRADSGDNSARYLACILGTGGFGTGFPLDGKLALRRVRDGADDGDDLCAIKYLVMVLQGPDFECGMQTAREYYSRSFVHVVKMANDGSAYASAVIGEYYLMAADVAGRSKQESNRRKHFTAALKYLRRGARLEDPIAKYHLFQCHVSRTHEDYELARTLLVESANADYTVAQVMAGQLCRDNNAPQSAENFFRRAAEQGDAMGQYGLGKLYELGIDGIPDHMQALYWLSKAAFQGHPQAIMDAADYFYSGKGSVARNLANAFRLYDDIITKPADFFRIPLQPTERIRAQNRWDELTHDPERLRTLDASLAPDRQEGEEGTWLYFVHDEDTGEATGLLIERDDYPKLAERIIERRRTGFRLQ